MAHSSDERWNVAFEAVKVSKISVRNAGASP